MAKYKVWISFSGCAAYEVEAYSENEACDIAMQEADPFDCDIWDCEVDTVKEHD